MRIAITALSVIALVVVIAIGIGQARDAADAGAPPRPLTRAEVSKPVAGVPPALAELRERVNDFRGGGVKAFDAQLRALRGHPVVVNMWGSWCDPCRRELPLFQREAIERADEVAFLGVDVIDDADNAAKLVATIPLPYPSYLDPRSNIATGRFRARVFPTTAFFDARGRMTLRQGEFPNRAKLAEAIERYALR